MAGAFPFLQQQPNYRRLRHSAPTDRVSPPPVHVRFRFWRGVAEWRRDARREIRSSPGANLGELNFFKVSASRLAQRVRSHLEIRIFQEQFDLEPTIARKRQSFTVRLLFTYSLRSAPIARRARDRGLCLSLRYLSHRVRAVSRISRRSRALAHRIPFHGERHKSRK